MVYKILYCIKKLIKLKFYIIYVSNVNFEHYTEEGRTWSQNF